MANTTLATLDYDFATTTLAFFRLKEVAAAAATLLIYDYATSFSEEVDHFWNGDWTVSRVLYFSIRYLSLAWALLQVFGELIRILNVKDACST
ncbi:hypothetical protein F5I97DRAFT_1443472 [Phlebopus sp. FC_14]|nr:hypothetical protein F5I97DRAFT_1443472 [Phlebopus sp. FC_14]